jgi:hypothetical protein
MEVTDELIIIAVSFACGAASAWMCLENRINEINAENDFILRRKDHIKDCWADVGTFIQGLREVTEGTGTVVGGYFDRADMDALKEKIKEIEILMADEWRLR